MKNNTVHVSLVLLLLLLWVIVHHLCESLQQQIVEMTAASQASGSMTDERGVWDKLGGCLKLTVKGQE